MSIEKKKRILILNNYSVKRVLQERLDGIKPSSHLYGIFELIGEGYELIIIDPEKNKFWDRVSNILNKIPLLEFGDMYLQFQAFKRRHEYDILYAPCQRVTLFLGLLSYMKIFNKRIIAVAHHPFLVGRLSFLRKYILYFSLKGHYKWGALSTVVAVEINKITKSNIAQCFHWGPELAFYDGIHSAEKPKSVDVMAIGRTGRDYKVLIDAYNNTDIKLEIYYPKVTVKELPAVYSSNITIIELDHLESLNYVDIINLYRTAKIMAIPLTAQPGLAGLTSLTDAIGLGMPVIMTRNDYVELNIEQEKLGFWIAPCDSDQWREKTLQLLNREKLLASFGENSRDIAEAKFNTQVYYQELIEIIKQA